MFVCSFGEAVECFDSAHLTHDSPCRCGVLESLFRSIRGSVGHASECDHRSARLATLGGVVGAASVAGNEQLQSDVVCVRCLFWHTKANRPLALVEPLAPGPHPLLVQACGIRGAAFACAKFAPRMLASARLRAQHLPHSGFMSPRLMPSIVNTQLAQVSGEAALGVSGSSRWQVCRRVAQCGWQHAANGGSQLLRLRLVGNMSSAGSMRERGSDHAPVIDESGVSGASG